MNTLIIATIGPATSEYAVLRSLIENGVNIVRLNFSHATYGQYRQVKLNLAQIKAETGLSAFVLQDLHGPRIRVGVLDHEIEMKEGETYSFMHKRGQIDNLEIPLDHDLSDDVRVGQHFFLSNGTIEVIVTAVSKDSISARVERGGLLLSRKGVNLPETNLNEGGITEKDFEDARFALNEGVDYIGLSFVQSDDDIKKMREFLAREFSHLKKLPKLIAKIERATALPVIDDIIREADGIMIARGDLGIEVPLEELPIIQKNLIRQAHWLNKPAIVATEMMASMIEHPKPTRAEVGDVANAIFDGADAVMLSDETAIGKYPLETVKMMRRVIKRTDEYCNHPNFFNNQ